MRVLQPILNVFKVRAPQGRLGRYLIAMFLGVDVIAILAALYLVLVPPKYVSGFTLILPGAGPSSSFNLESLGQASTQSKSPYGGHSVSPTENYKQILRSYRLRGLVAQRLERPIEDVAFPQVRLVNQTYLMSIGVDADNASDAYTLAMTWMEEFQIYLDTLRMEERQKREQFYTSNIAGFRGRVVETRKALLNHQNEHRIISSENYGELVERTDSLQYELAESKTKASQLYSELSHLYDVLDLTPAKAALILTLHSDPVFVGLLDSYSKSEEAYAEIDLIWAENNPEKVSLDAERMGLKTALMNRGSELLGVDKFYSLSRKDYTAKADRSELISRMILLSTEYKGEARRRDSLAQRLKDFRAEIQRLKEPAAELDSLTRAHKTAETVFASALATNDISKFDVFASYPLTQVLEPPGYPEKARSPSLKLAVLGGFAALFFYTMTLGLLWLRLPLVNAVLKII